MEYRRIDVDAHYQELPDTWTKRMSRAKWGDRVPHIADNADGTQYWLIDGKRRIERLASCSAVLPTREDTSVPKRWENIPSRIYNPGERLKDMDRDEVDVQVLYPNISGGTGETFFGTEPDFEAECIRAYNDYLTEEVRSFSERYVPLSIVPFSHVSRAAEEIRYTAQRGHRGVVMLSAPHQRKLPFFNDPYWDPFWAEAQELQFPVNFHGSGGAPKMRVEIIKGTSARRSRALTGSLGFNLQAQFCANLMFSGVLERFPSLTFVYAESGLGWVPYLLEMSDYEWEQCQLYKHGHPIRPSELFKRQCYVDFWYETVGLQHRQVIGVDRILWESDYPHPTSIWPDSSAWLERSLEGVPEDERHMILVENPRRVYRI